MTKKTAIITIMLLLGATALAQWVGPSATAPAGSLSAPINLGGNPQVKQSALGVTSFTVDSVSPSQQPTSPLLADISGNSTTGSLITNTARVSYIAQELNATQPVCVNPTTKDLGLCTNQVPPAPTPVVTLSATPVSITGAGSTTLTWSTQNTPPGTVCAATRSLPQGATLTGTFNGWNGSVTPIAGGNATYALSTLGSYVFTITCTASGQPVGTANATVTVTAAPVIYGGSNIYAWTNNGPDTLDFFVQVNGNNQPYLKYEIESYNPYYSGNGWFQVSAFTMSQSWLDTQAQNFYSGQYNNIPATLANGPVVSCPNAGAAFTACTSTNRPTGITNPWRDTRMGGHGDHDRERAGMPQPFRIRAYDANNTPLPWRYFCPENVLAGNPPYNIIPTAWTYIACPTNVGGIGDFGGIRFKFTPATTIQLPMGGGTASVTWDPLSQAVQNNLVCITKAYNPQGVEISTPGDWWENVDPASATSASGNITQDTTLKIRCGDNYNQQWTDVTNVLYEISRVINVAP